MQRLIALLLALLLSVSVGLGAAAHAMEPFASIDASEAGCFGHTPGDADEVPADADKTYPHHHGACHDHGIDVPTTAQRGTPGDPAPQTRHRQPDTVLVSAASDPLRRPPRA